MTADRAGRICPDCQRPLAGPVCECGWAVGARDGVPEYLSTHDRQSPLFADYIRTYDEIASDDLATSMQPKGLLERKSASIIELLGPLDPGTRVCDVGVGQGDVLGHLRARPGLQVTGVDIASPYLRRLVDDPAVDVLVANAENLPFAGAFDVVVSTDVIEHVLNVGDYLLSVHRALRPGGRFVVRAPYREDLLQYARQRGCSYDMVHLRAFDRRLLVEQLRAAGFQPQRVELDGYFPGRTRRWLGSGAIASRAAGVAERTVLGPRYRLRRAHAFAAHALVLPVEITVAAQRA